MNKADLRRREMLRKLYYRKLISCKTLACEFDVTVRTIYNDIEILTCSYPLETIMGCTGGVRLSDEYICSHKVLHSDETELIDRIRSRLKGRDRIIFDRIFSEFALY